MNSEKVLQWFIIAVVILLLFPVVKAILPKKVSVDRAVEAFNAAGLYVTENYKAQYPELGSVETWTMYVDVAKVTIYRYDQEGKIATQYAYQQQDPGSAIVESMGIAQSMGADVRKNTRGAARRGMFLLIADTPNDALRNQILQIFRSL